MAEQHEKALVPQIRFTGFTDPWEQRKLGELASKRIEKNTNGIKETFTNSAEHGVVSQLDYFDHDITNDANIGNYSVVHPDDFIYNPRISAVAPCGPINRNKLDRNGVMSPLYTVFSVDDTIDKLYLEHYFKTSRWHQFMFLEGNSGARSDRFSISDSIFFEMPIQCPVLEEQELIASFFGRLDSLITLHQRKYDKLCVLKKSMLDKMFPKGGSLYPEIRFAGFTDPWEQRKLEDYVVVSTAKNVDGRFNKEDVLSVSGEYGIVNQIAFQGRSFAGSSVLNYGIVNTGDIVYTKSPLNSNPYGIIKVNKGIPGIVSTLYAVYRPQDNVHTNFIQVYFEQHERMNNYMHPLVNKGAKNDMKVTAENALKGVVTFPSREEQVIISEFFDRLDSLITLHQRKYDGCANPLFLERRISCRKPSHQNRCSATTTPSG